MALDPDLAERSLTQALVDREVRIRPDQDSPGMGVGVVIATVPAEGAITVGACLDRLADTALSTPPPGLSAAGRSADARRADALVGLVGLAACVLAALTQDTAATEQGAVDASGAQSDADIGATIAKAVRAAVVAGTLDAAAPVNAGSVPPTGPADPAPTSGPFPPPDPVDPAYPAMPLAPAPPADLAARPTRRVRRRSEQV